MTERLMIIVTGAPGTGKTTLSRQLAERYNIPLVAKDEIKELLFDNIGIGDRQWALKLGIASYKLMYKFIDKLLFAGKPFIVESNFYNEGSREEFMKAKSKQDFKAIQIHCYTEPEVLYERYKKRDASGERHKGHIHPMVEFDKYKENVFDSKTYKLDISGSTFIDVDTTDFEFINYNSIYDQLDEIFKEYIKLR